MVSLDGIFESLVSLRFSSEDFCRVIDFDAQLKELPGDEVAIEDEYTLTPFYIYGGKRYEFYDHELNIRLVDERGDFDEFLLRLTGRKDIREVPLSVRLRQEIVYAEVLKSEGVIQKERLRSYIACLLGSTEVQEEAKRVFSLSSFDAACLYFALY